MRYLRRFNETINHIDAEHLFVDFIDAGGSVDMSFNDNYVDIFNVESDEEIKVINLHSLNPRALDIFGSFRGITIGLKNINADLTVDAILFANDYLAGYGYHFKYLCLFSIESAVLYMKDPNDITNYGVRNITLVYEDLS